MTTDVVPAKDILPPDGIDILDVEVGHLCRVIHDGQLHDAKILAIGVCYFRVSECGVYMNNYVSLYRKATLGSRITKSVRKTNW